MSFEFVESSGETTSSSQNSSALDFVKGFITGQVALLTLLLFIVRFLFFRSVGPVAPSSNTVKLESSSFGAKKQKKKTGNFPIAVPFENDSSLLERLFGLDHQLLKQQATKSGHAEILISDETARWINFILAKIIFSPFSSKIQNNPSYLSSTLQDKLEQMHEKKGNTTSALKHLDSIHIKSLSIGNYYPSINSYQLCYDTLSECCALRIKCSWQDSLSLEVESALNLIGLIALPFSVSVKLKNIRFTAQIQNSKDGNCFEFSCLPDDNLLIDLEVGSLLGHRTKLKDLPKIKNAIVEAVKKILADTIISPQSIKIPIPNLDNILSWPTSEKNEDSLYFEDTEGKPEYDTYSSIVKESKLDDIKDDSMVPETSVSLMNDASIDKSLISDESEPMNLFLDSRYDDDFYDEIESGALLNQRTVKTQ